MTAINQTISVTVPPEPAYRSVVVAADGFAYQRLSTRRRDSKNWACVTTNGLVDVVTRCSWLDLLAKGDLTIVWDPSAVPSRAEVLAKIDRRLAELFPRALRKDRAARDEAARLLQERVAVISVPIDPWEGPSGVPA